MNQCDRHECDTVSTLRWPVTVNGEYLLFCYECYMKWLRREDEEISVFEDGD